MAVLGEDQTAMRERVNENKIKNLTISRHILGSPGNTDSKTLEDGRAMTIEKSQHVIRME